MIRIAMSIALLILCSGCTYFRQIAWEALDQAGRYSARPLEVADIATPDGFRVVRVVNGLNFPSAFTWDDEGNLYILESHTVPVPMLRPKIVRVARDGRISRVEWRGTHAPSGEIAIGLTFHEGWLYFSHEQSDGTFSISRVSPSGGEVEPVVQGMPVQGDHDVNHLVFDGEGTLYFGVGSATNSGVVSADDPVNEKWLEQHPGARDIPCRDIHLTGQTFHDGSVSGAYQSYGESGATLLREEAPCTSSLYRLPRGATTPELVAWGFRNPVALAFDRDGTLLVGNQGADERSTRPIANDPDGIWRVREGVWYGWPDFSASLEPITSTRYATTPTPLQFVIDHAASGLTAPDPSLLIAATKPHAAVSGMAVLPNGDILLAEMGDFKPMTADDEEHAGYQVERVDRATGRLGAYLRNRGDGDPLPSSTLDLRNGLERPVDVRIGPDGIVYVLDFGAFVTRRGEPKAMPKTGKLFRVEPR